MHAMMPGAVDFQDSAAAARARVIPVPYVRAAGQRRGRSRDFGALCVTHDMESLCRRLISQTPPKDGGGV